MTIVDIPLTTPEVSEPERVVIDFAPLVKARLREKGWQQGKYGKPEGPNCVMGALGHVIRGVVGNDDPYKVDNLEETLAERLIDGLGVVTPFYSFIEVEAWNDRPERTLDDVFDLLDKADLKVPVSI